MSNTPGNTKNTSAKPKRANGRGSIYQITKSNGRKVWKAAIKDINGKLRTKNFTKFALAEDWLAEQRRTRDLGLSTYSTNPKMSVGQFMENWIESHKRVIKYSTYRSYKSCIKNKINPSLGSLKVSNLTPATIENFYNDLVANGIAGGTLNLVHRTLSCAISEAVRLGDLPRNPVTSVKKPNLKSISTRPIPEAHWRQIYLQATKDPYLHARIEIGVMIGLRPGEVRGLKWDDIDFETQTLTIARQVQPGPTGKLEFQSVKQNQIRTIPISKIQVRILQNHKRNQSLNKAGWKVDEDLVFPNSIGGKQDEKRDRARFKSIVRSCGLPDYQLYQLRKNAYTNLAQQTDIRTLKAYTGHTQLSTLINSYLFETDESLLRAVSGMDSIRPIEMLSD